MSNYKQIGTSDYHVNPAGMYQRSYGGPPVAVSFTTMRRELEKGMSGPEIFEALQNALHTPTEKEV
jgi:hypothetical protein